MSWLSQLLHPGRAYNQASQMLGQGFNQAQGFRNPYMMQGQDAYKHIQEMLSSLADPDKLQTEWSSKYQESPYAKQLESAAKQRGMESASAQGLLGSSAALSNVQNSATGIMNQDRQQYMNDMMQKYMGGLSGFQNLYGTGANFAGQSANSAESLASGQAALGFGGQTAGASMLGQGAGGLFNMLMQYLMMGQGGH